MIELMSYVMRYFTTLSFTSILLQMLFVPFVIAQDTQALLPVDCLLPGQVRKLGSVTTYITPRRPVQTTAIDCEIRGGEYVAHDRASYATALKIWLAAAESGDASAQLYVAHIYEKGLGIAPNYVKAADWYKKASDAGNAEASIGLAQLYEKGLGVERNLSLAKSLYRTAMGESANLVIDGSTPGEGYVTLDAAEYEALVELLGGKQDQPYSLLELARLHEGERAKVQSALDEANAAVARQQQLLVAEQAKSESLNGELANTLASLTAVQRQRDEQNKAIASLQKQQRKPAELLVRQTEKINALMNDIARQESEAKALRDAIDEQGNAAGERKTMQAQVAKLESALSKRNEKLLGERQKQEEYRTALEQKSAEIARLTKTAEQYEAQIAALREAVEAPRQQLDEQAKTIASLRQEASDARQAVTEYQTRLARTEVAADRLNLDEMPGPTLAMIDPGLVQTRGMALVSVAMNQPKRQVTGRVDAPAGLISLTINGMPSTVNDKGIFTESIDVMGEVTPVDVVAIDTLGKRSAVSFELSTTSIAPEKPKQEKISFGKYYALIIGNSNYQYLPDLVTPKADVSEVAQILEQQYGFKNTVLIDVGRNQIINALNEFRKTLTSEDNFLIYYAGHGGLDEVNNRGHWLPVDADWDNPANWLNNTVITDFLNMINAKQILVVSDSCYSGALTRSAMVTMQGGMTDAEYKQYLSVLSKKKARTALTSGGLKPVLDVGGGKHSVFSQALLESLESNDDVIEGQRLYRAVLARVSLRASSINFEQEPEYAPINFAGHEGGDFLFVPRRQQM